MGAHVYIYTKGNYIKFNSKDHDLKDFATSESFVGVDLKTFIGLFVQMVKQYNDVEEACEMYDLYLLGNVKGEVYQIPEIDDMNISSNIVNYINYHQDLLEFE